MNTWSLGLSLLLALPTLWLLTVSGYLLLLALLALVYRGPRGTAGEVPRILLAIPAHNESAGIAKLLEETQRLDYPGARYTVAVIADNCSDETAALARAAGATVLERHDLENRGKGQALHWFIRAHAALLAEHEVVALVDADMRIDPQFLRAMADAFGDARVQVTQALNTVADPDRDVRSALGLASFQFVNHVRPAGRCALGGTGELKGSGMAFRRAVLEQYGWPAHSVTEDVEFSKQLLLDGVRVHYVPAAKVTSPIPETRAQATIQQERWEQGKGAVVRTYFPRYLRAFLRTPRIAYLDALLDLLVPPLSLLVVALVAVGLLGLLAHPAITGVAAFGLAVVAFAVISGLAAAHPPARVWMYLLAAPWFIAWKLPLLARALLRRGNAWQRTPRTNELPGAAEGVERE